MSLTGYFSNIKNAKEAVEKLKNENYNAYYDINDHIDLINETTASLIYNSAAYKPGKGILEAASPMNSGMGKIEEIADINCKVVVKANDNIEQAKKIIREMGGEFRNDA
jgi:hypothetical protein